VDKKKNQGKIGTGGYTLFWETFVKNIIMDHNFRRRWPQRLVSDLRYSCLYWFHRWLSGCCQLQAVLLKLTAENRGGRDTGLNIPEMFWTGMGCFNNR
jgi:hypothetical protein